MRKKLIIFSCILCATIGLAIQQIDFGKAEGKKTGIMLDSLNNEVMLAYEHGRPAYYYANIFTPVCETGECKPIYINIYWDLMGNYDFFDQPNGEILTKLDHEPFTEEDYNLLDEILGGEDPRYGMAVKHSSPGATASNDSGKKEKSESESMPSPGAAATQMVFMKKMEMVDGISGATLPELRDKFVPGALYTTYTCWDLANTRRLRMEHYTRDNLFSEENYDYFFAAGQEECREALVQHMASESDEENAHANILMSIADTAHEMLAQYCIRSVNYFEVELDTVQNVLARRYFAGGSSDFKRNIIYKWGASPMKGETITKLSSKLSEDSNISWDLIYLFRDQGYWPKGVVGNLVRQMPEFESKEMQQALYNVIAVRRASMTTDEWDLLKHMKKQLKLK